MPWTTEQLKQLAEKYAEVLDIQTTFERLREKHLLVNQIECIDFKNMQGAVLFSFDADDAAKITAIKNALNQQLKNALEAAAADLNDKLT